MTHLDETEGTDAAPHEDELDKPVKNPHDAAFKSAFRKIDLARSFFRHFLPTRFRVFFRTTDIICR